MSRLEQAVDIILKLKDTKQIYIIGHDIPISISKQVYFLLEQKRLETAAELGVPENQYEFEDLIMLLVGGITMEQVKAGIEAMRKHEQYQKST